MPTFSEAFMAALGYGLVFLIVYLATLIIRAWFVD